MGTGHGKRSMERIFLLDLDDTLLDFAKAERENLTRTLAVLGVGTDEEVFARYHEINDGLWKMLERGEITRAALKIKRFESLFAQLGLSADPVLAGEEYLVGFPEICYPFDGAAEFLKTLKNRGRVYICTNGTAFIQRRHIELGGFLPYLDGVFISEEVGADKPSKAYAEHVATHIPAFCPEDAVYIGDSLTSDRGCAEALGVRFVLFAPRGVPKDYAGERAESYGELLSLL